MASVRSDGAWVCQCRRCCGVLTGADAVQYVWEFALGSCDVPTVVGVNADLSGFVCCAFTYWHGEPPQPYPIGDLGEFIVSCRPGAGTVATEGDIARWVSWETGPQPPRDWLVVDGTRFRSVSATVDALRRRLPMPDEHAIAGDWNGEPLDPAFRADVRENWIAIERRNQATSRF